MTRVLSSLMLSTAVVCSVGSVAANADVPQRLVGLTEEQLLSCAGIPAGSMVSGATTFFQYGEFSERGQVVALGGSLFVSKRQKGCQAVVSLRNGRVVNVTLKKKGLISGPMACERIFSGC
jgi:hypothetical protein